MQFWPPLKGQLDSIFSYCIEVNKFSSIHTVHVGVVLCPASLSHAEKESGEMCIQFWFRAPRCWRGQSACRTVLTSLKKISILT